jgi:DNA-binding response OmpR family regulator
MSTFLERVLIVDDEPRVSAMLQETLSYLGCVAEVPSSGDEALRALHDSQPNVQSAFDYIAKPFDLARLRQVVEAVMADGG